MQTFKCRLMKKVVETVDSFIVFLSAVTQPCLYQRHPKVLQHFASRSFPVKSKFTPLSDEIFPLSRQTSWGSAVSRAFEMDTKYFKTQMYKRADVEITARCAKTRDWVLTKSALLQSKTVQWSAAKINLNVFSLRDTGATNEAENTVTSVKLFGKNHWFLRLQDDGNVTGTREQGNGEGKAK